MIFSLINIAIKEKITETFISYLSFRPCFRSARRTFCLLSHIPTFVARILTPQATHNILLFSIHNKHFSSKIICSSATNRFWKQNCKHPIFIVALVAPATGMLICIINTSTYHSSKSPRAFRQCTIRMCRSCIVVVRSYLCRVATSFWVIKNNVNNKYRLLPERPWSDSIKNFIFVTSLIAVSKSSKDLLWKLEYSPKSTCRELQWFTKDMLQLSSVKCF